MGNKIARSLAAKGAHFERAGGELHTEGLSSYLLDLAITIDGAS